MTAVPEFDIPDAPIPVSILTGCLGSGKTTVLNRLLPRLRPAARLGQFQRLVFITRDLDEKMFERTLKAFNEQGPGPLDPDAG